jgi:hypothetical protein
MLPIQATTTPNPASSPHASALDRRRVRTTTKTTATGSMNTPSAVTPNARQTPGAIQATNHRQLRRLRLADTPITLLSADRARSVSTGRPSRPAGAWYRFAAQAVVREGGCSNRRWARSSHGPRARTQGRSPSPRRSCTSCVSVAWPSLRTALVSVAGGDRAKDPRAGRGVAGTAPARRGSCGSGEPGRCPRRPRARARCRWPRRPSRRGRRAGSANGWPG